VIARALGWLALGLLLVPLAYASWLSFAPGELLEPPRGEWSLRWYREFLANPQWTTALGNSVAVALGSTALALVAGTGLALALAGRRLRGAAWLSGLVLLPLFVPGVVLGMALLPWMHRTGLWGTLVSLMAAHALWSLPVVYLVARTALEEADPELELAARSLGAGPVRTFLRVTLPLVRASLVAGAASAFVLSLNEFAIALFLGTPEIETLPRVIWPSLRYTLTPLVAAASGATLAVTAAGLALVALLAKLHGVVLDRRTR
jgi:ABC-type spermidine/putrescine transport system permease subunit II